MDASTINWLKLGRQPKYQDLTKDNSSYSAVLLVIKT